MIGGRFKVASVASIAAAGLFMGGVAAQAADLGGNCCADLEERVAELEATTARKGNRRTSLTIYGQVSRAIVWHNDSASVVDDFTSRDNSGWSGTRFGFTGSGKINGDLSAGFRIEIGVDNEERETAGDIVASEEGTTFRRTYVYLSSQSLGTLKLGRENSATEGIAEVCLGCATTLGGAMEGGSVSSLAATGNIDGSRRNGVHYNTPLIAGFTVSASWFHQGAAGNTSASTVAVPTTQDGWDVAVRYAGEFGAIRVAAGIGYQNLDAFVSESTQISGSASVMHTPTGLFIAGYAGDAEASTGVDTDAWGVQAGIQTKWNSLGNTTFDVRYGESNSNANSFNPYYYGVAMKQAIDAVAGDLVLNWTHYDQDSGLATGDDVDVVTAGMIVRF